MVYQGLQSQEDMIGGIVEFVGLVVIAHFENPATDHATYFWERALLWKKNTLYPIPYTLYPIPSSQEVFKEYNKWLEKRLKN